jgi:ATP-binding cassette, subfamily G (WHITE), member 2, PDR
MVNEFHNLRITCEPPQLIPPYGSPQNQGCALPGATAGSDIVLGDNYVTAQLTYSYGHLWRNVGIIFAFWGFFVAVTLFALERRLQSKEHAGNASVYKTGAAPHRVKRTLEGNERDEEEMELNNLNPARQTSAKRNEELQDIAKSETIFTWRDVKYTIPFKHGRRILLNDVQGYVKPGVLTALMGGQALGG